MVYVHARCIGQFSATNIEIDLLNVDDLKDPVFQENILDDLVLKEEAKNLIQALSNTAMGDTTIEDRSDSFGHWTADIVQNKGEGRIFLLHGKPGVGKSGRYESRGHVVNTFEAKRQQQNASPSPHGSRCLPSPVAIWAPNPR